MSRNSTTIKKFVAVRIADGVQRSFNTLRPAEIAFGQIDVPEHLNNRRWFMRPGSMPVNPFGETSELVKMKSAGGEPEPHGAGGSDRSTDFVLRRSRTRRQAISVLAAYSLHYVGGPGGLTISADYFGVFSEEMKRLLGAERQDPPFVAMMANATSGDINNNNFRNPSTKKKGPFEQTRYVANDCAAKVHAAMKELKYRRDLTLDARYREAPIVWRRPTPEQGSWPKQILADARRSAPRGNVRRASGRGDTSVLSSPREPSLRSRSPRSESARTALSSLCSGCGSCCC